MSDAVTEGSIRPDRNYYAQRAEAERRLATIAIDERARVVHAQLAAEYAARAKVAPAND